MLHIDFTLQHHIWNTKKNWSAVESIFNAITLLDFILENTRCRKVIVAGSCWEYGKVLGECQEQDLININSFFTWAKATLYQYLAIKCDQVDATLIWFRIFYLYGPRQRKESLIPTLIHSFKTGKLPEIKTPLNKNDFFYVEDAASIIQLTLDNLLYSGIYNIGSGQSTSVYEVCRIAEKLITKNTNFSHEILEKGSNEETVNFWASTQKLKNSIYLDRITELESGIKKTIEQSE